MTEERPESFLIKWKRRIGKCFRHFLRLLKRASHELSYLKRPDNAASIRHLFKECTYVLKAVLPKKGGGWLRFGGSDPCKTGQVMELLAVFYPVYGKRIQIVPEFEEPVLETELHASGRIYLFQLLFAGIRLLLDKNLRKMYRHFSGENIESELESNEKKVRK